MKLETFEIQIGDQWFPVKGLVNAKGWLEWKDKDGAGGLKKPGTFRKIEKREPNKFTITERPPKGKP